MCTPAKEGLSVLMAGSQIASPFLTFVVGGCATQTQCQCNTLAGLSASAIDYGGLIDNNLAPISGLGGRCRAKYILSRHGGRRCPAPKKSEKFFPSSAALVRCQSLPPGVRRLRRNQGSGVEKLHQRMRDGRERPLRGRLWRPRPRDGKAGQLAGDVRKSSTSGRL